jgi:hypothetical protein
MDPVLQPLASTSQVCPEGHWALPFADRCIACGHVFGVADPSAIGFNPDEFGFPPNPFAPEPDTWEMPRDKVDARWMTEAVRSSLRKDAWRLLEEVAYRDDQPRRRGPRVPPGRRIDLLGFRPPHAPEHGPVERIAIEIKCSRSDYLSDVRNPEKQAPWRRLANWHAFAAPAGLIRPDEVPQGSGLLEAFLWVSPARGTEVPVVAWTKLPPLVDAPYIPGWLILELASRASLLEGRKSSH